MIDISVIFIHHRLQDMLMGCLRSLYEKECQVQFETIVINKESGDGTSELVKSTFPQVTVINRMEPFGIASYRNFGMKAARGRHIANLDIDILFCDGMLDNAVRFMDEYHDAGCAGGKLLGLDGSLQYSCRTFYTLPIILMRRTPLRRTFKNSRIERKHLMMDWDHNSIRTVDWVSGGFSVIRRDAIEDIGYLDENYFYAFEEVDFCYRLWEAGWKVYYCPDAQIVHFENRPSFGINKLAFEHLKSGIRFWWKHYCVGNGKEIRDEDNISHPPAAG